MRRDWKLYNNMLSRVIWQMDFNSVQSFKNDLFNVVDYIVPVAEYISTAPTNEY